MGVFTKYQITDDKIYLTESIYWTFEPNRPDEIRDWVLSGVENPQLYKSKLDTLIAYEEDAEIEELNKDGENRFIVYTYLDSEEYVFECKDIYQELRPYNTEELTEIILRRDDIWKDRQKIIRSKQKILDDLNSFVNEYIDRKSKNLESMFSSSGHVHQRSKDQLDILMQIKTILDSDSLD